MANSPEPPDRLSTCSFVGALWLGVLGPPVLWLAQFQTNYTLVPWVCAHGHRWTITAVNLAALVVAALLALLSWRNWKTAGVQWPSRARDTATRTRFLSVLGLMSGALFFLAIVAQSLAPLWIDPCRQ